jgi:hypothetical protein
MGFVSKKLGREKERKINVMVVSMQRCTKSLQKIVPVSRERQPCLLQHPEQNVDLSMKSI